MYNVVCGICCGTVKETTVQYCVEGFTVGRWERLFYNIVCVIYCGTVRVTTLQCCVGGFTVGMWDRLLYNVVCCDLLWDCEKDYCIMLFVGFTVGL